MTKRKLMFVVFLVATYTGVCHGDSFLSRRVVPSLANDPASATLDLAPVHLQTKHTYGATDYVIPKAYLDGERLWQGGVQDHILIEAFLPGMEPWTIAGERLFQQMLAEHPTLPKENVREFQGMYDSAYFKDWVSVKISYGHCFGWSRSQPEWIKKWARHDATKGDSQFERYVSGTPASGLHDLFVPKAQGQFNIYVDCPEYGGSLRRCRAITDYDALVAYEYWFSVQRLNEYRAIDDKVKEMLRTFIKRSKPSTEMPRACPVAPVNDGSG